MTVEAEPSPIPGCLLLHLFRHEDPRGGFQKLFERRAFAALGMDTDVAEAYWSTSHRGVVRGLHFQLPPHHHAKTVVAVAGTVHDVVLDLRTDSPAFGTHAAFTLDAAAGLAVHVPAGCAHGFQALTEGAGVAYLVSTEHAPDHDTGVRWDSAGIAWPLPPTVISDRDAGLPRLADFDSPFRLLRPGPDPEGPR